MDTPANQEGKKLQWDHHENGACSAAHPKFLAVVEPEPDPEEKWEEPWKWYIDFFDDPDPGTNPDEYGFSATKEEAMAAVEELADGSFEDDIEE